MSFRRRLGSVAVAVVLTESAAVDGAYAQVRSATPSAPMHATMPTPGTASPPVTGPAVAPLPSQGSGSPVRRATPVQPDHAEMPTPATVPPPIVMAPPNLLAPNQIPPGIPPDSMAPIVPVPAGTPIGPPHP